MPRGGGQVCTGPRVRQAARRLSQRPTKLAMAAMVSVSARSGAWPWSGTRWDRFARFLDDGRICLTTAERALRGFALGRKSWLTHHCDIVETGNDSWRFKNRDDDQATRARAVSATPTSSDGASATAKIRRSRGSLLDADTGSRSNAD